MKAIIRERVLDRLMAIPDLVDLHRQQNPMFVDRLLAWFSDSEEALKPLRSPLVARLASFRGQLQAADEGVLHPQVNSESRSPRKRRNALAVVLLQSAEMELREALDNIDKDFDVLKDKLAQLIAIVSSKNPLPHSMHLTESYLDTIWVSLREFEETQSMSYFIEVQTDLTDRRYLLQGLLGNIIRQTH